MNAREPEPGAQGVGIALSPFTAGRLELPQLKESFMAYLIAALPAVFMAGVLIWRNRCLEQQMNTSDVQERVPGFW